MTNNGKAKIEKTFNGLNIIIPSKKNWFILLFMTAWMGGWFFGFVSVSGILFSETDFGGANGFFIFWLIAWTVGGLMIAFTSLGVFRARKVYNKQE